MEGEAVNFIQAGIKYNIDPLFLVSIAHHESHYAKSYPKTINDSRHNFAGVMDWTDGKRHLKQYDSWHDSIYDLARVLREKYLNQNKITIRQVWYKYCPPGLSENAGSLWGYQVVDKYSSLRTLSSFK